MMDLGEAGMDFRPGAEGDAKTLRQKDQIPYETLESDDAPTKPNLSG